MPHLTERQICAAFPILRFFQSYLPLPLARRLLTWNLDHMKVRLLLVDYRLVPQHRFPAALDDCFTVYLWLLNQGAFAPELALALPCSRLPLLT